VFTLVTSGDGEHTVTVRVTPENLGPVTVRAHVSGQNANIELFAPSDAGRDAIRQIMPELRRDLAGSGLNANLDLSSRNQPDSGFLGGERGRQQDAADPYTEQPRRVSIPQMTSALPHVPTRGSASTLDVIA
jgi:flagellar hook-length control protein FliK